MGAIIPIGFGQARLIFQLAGRPAGYVVTHGYDAAVSGGDFDATVAAENIRDQWQDPDGPVVSGMMLQGYTFAGVETTEMTATGPITGSAQASLAGTLSGAPLPPNCAMLITKLTGRGGRKGRGRMFFPPFLFTENSVDALGNINADLGPSFQAMFDAVIEALTTGGYPPMLLHDDATPPTAITGFRISTRLATQRRRMR